MQSGNRFVSGIVWMITLVFVVVVQTSPARAVTEKVLHSFAGADGFLPYASVVLDAAGNLYGTTASGGLGFGTVFELKAAGDVWKEEVLYSFAGGSDGGNPYGGLVFDTAGNLYGTTRNGGTFGSGTVFELSASGGVWTKTTAYSFGANHLDGCLPQGDLTIDSLGNLYGTTSGCGEASSGTVFEVSPSGGGWIETTLWSFHGTDGQSPVAGVVFDTAGNLYGMTPTGGTFSQGNVFKLTPMSGTWTGTSIFSFTGGDNGCTPYGEPVLDKAGSLYGTTQRCGADEVGTVFMLKPTQGQWTMSVIHSFTGGIDGGSSRAGLRFDSAGNLYGTTQLGGLFGNGAVFRLTLEKSGRWREAEYSFMGGSDGSSPYSAPTVGTSSLFGTTVSGGTDRLGTVYEITEK
jgi:uncharacterized repeat protein (TIGR03803 family)